MANEKQEPKHTLAHDDKRVGHLNEDGSVKSWPRQRIDGKVFNRSESYTALSCGELHTGTKVCRHFVILTPNSGLSADDIVIKAEASKSVPSAPAPRKVDSNG